MKCHRCGGSMACEKICYGTEQFWVWRCIFCGEYIDPVVLENRQYQKSNRAKGQKNWEDAASTDPAEIEPG